MSLLPALQALLDTTSVTKAAELMHVTQSTMSRTLSQLRDALNDPILVRSGNRISLSEKAKRIQPEVDKILSQANDIFEESSFNPETCTKQFSFVTGMNFQQRFLSTALTNIRSCAPGMSFIINISDKDSIKDLKDGVHDLGIFQTSVSDDELTETPIADGTVCILVKKNHPLAKYSDLTMAQLDDYPFIGSDAPMVTEKAARKLKENSDSIASPWLTIANFSAILDILRSTDAFTLVTLLMQPELANSPDFQVIPLPVEFPPATLKLIWPQHWECNSAHQWLRNRIEQELRHFYAQYNDLEKLRYAAQ
ncbi:LysR family transcriptional regulator [Endozoicomonas ascidiicola]|uniref:LysR family transcriptional regulator n=2 Tax=Endozoicomonas ascidiicola TaxID=1698521 RepID=UPI00082F625F|nr:LysR family transcriptional regulator [Endozoicomonas ascidiicola]